MTPSQAAELLAIAATFDRRTVGDLEARSWAKALWGLRPADCAEAIAVHYSRTTDWLMPAHVRHEVRRIRVERLRSVPSSELEPADVDPTDIRAYQDARRALIRRIGNGDPLPVRPALPARPVEAFLEVEAGRRGLPA